MIHTQSTPTDSPPTQRLSLERVTAPFAADVRLWRERLPTSIQSRARSNIPHSCILHSPFGLDWGSSSPGCADLALNILNAFVPPRAARRLPRRNVQRDDDPHV